MTAVDERYTDYVALEDLPPALRNPKQHDEQGIRRSIERFGFATPGVLDERTGRLVAGHGRAIVLRQMRDEGASAPGGIRVDEAGRWLVPITRGWSSRSDAEAEAFLVADNRWTELGGWDHEMLKSMLDGVAQVDAELAAATGWDPAELDDMLKSLQPPDLDDLARDRGDPEPSDTWPVIKIKAPPHVAAAWRSHVEEHDGDEVAALAALLEVDPTKPAESTWEP